ncbi:MAG: lectin-like protein [Candidatus Poribacteria bacterium]|nr:lectin-like protein [Candidatus Poribacteria bacterium]
MDRPYTTQKLAVLALTLLFTVICVAAAQDPEHPALQPPSGMSGKVIDAEGNPVAGFTFAIQPMRFRDGHLQPEGGFRQFQVPLEGMEGPGMPRTTSQVKTDADGTFTATNIQPGLVQLNAVSSATLDAIEKFDPEKIRQGAQIPQELMRFDRLEPDMEILSIQIGKVTFFSKSERHVPDFMRGLTFALKPGVTLENLKITVKSRLRIRARIIYADGTPLANAQADLSMRQRDEHNPNSGGTHGTDCFTDADGYFTQYRDEPGFYTLSVEYSGLSGGAGPFLLKDGVAPENLVITLDGNPPDVEGATAQKVGVGGPIEEGKVRVDAGNIVVEEVEVPPKVVARAVVPPQAPKPPKSVWVINPANGHAYKKIQCQDWHDAQQKAVEEGAHLVSINDEDEQHWLQVIFRSHSTWIGLTDVEKEGTWQWDSGEPVTYTNWAAQPVFPDGQPETEKDYVVMTFRDGEWQSISPESHFWRMAREAIIEKDGLVSTAPVVETSDEE